MELNADFSISMFVYEKVFWNFASISREACFFYHPDGLGQDVR